MRDVSLIKIHCSVFKADQHLQAVPHFGVPNTVYLEILGRGANSRGGAKRKRGDFDIKPESGHMENLKKPPKKSTQKRRRTVVVDECDNAESESGEEGENKSISTHVGS